MTRPLCDYRDISRERAKINGCRSNVIVARHVAESPVGAHQNREGVERRRLRQQKEGSGGAPSRSGGRRGTAAGGALQGGGYLRAAASSPASLLREDHGEYPTMTIACMRRSRAGIPAVVSHPLVCFQPLKSHREVNFCLRGGRAWSPMPRAFKTKPDGIRMTSPFPRLLPGQSSRTS